MNLLYISSYVDDWPLARRVVYNNKLLVLAVNVDNEHLTDFGAIGFEKKGRGLVRLKDW